MNDSRLNLTIGLLAIVATAMMFVTSGEPGRANSIGFNLSVGYLVSALFWLLVIYIPERSRQKILRDNLDNQYKNFRRSVIQILLWCSIGMHDSELPEQLNNYEQFKAFFGANRKSNWYAALNGLEEEKLRMRELVFELETFADDIEYVLNKVNITDAKVHSLLKDIKQHIFRLNHSDIYTDEQVKYVGQFLWEILAQWSFIDGQRKEDIIQNAIDRL